MSIGRGDQVADRPTVVLRVVLLAVFGSSVVHYTDNYLRFDAYAQGNAGLVTRPVIAVSWILFTVLGALAYVSFRRRRWRTAAWCIAAYSVGGLISPLHYTAVAASSYDAVQHTFIATDLLAGLAVVASERIRRSAEAELRLS